MDDFNCFSPLHAQANSDFHYLPSEALSETLVLILNVFAEETVSDISCRFPEVLF